MTDTDTIGVGRRTFLRGVGVGTVGIGGMSIPVSGNGGGNGGGSRESLLDGPAEYQLFWSDDGAGESDPDALGDFGYPTNPADRPLDGEGNNGAFLAGEDPAGGLFDAAEIEKTPNGKTLHHTLRFFQGFLMERNRGKPYALVNEGRIPGTPFFRFTARGQHVNFEAVSRETLAERLGPLANAPPLSVLAGETWRGVGSEVVYLLAGADGSPSRIAPYSATRVDFYRRSRGEPAYELSVLYVIYPNLDADGNATDDAGNPIPTDPENPVFGPIPGPAYAEGAQLITGGRRNLGGQ